MQVEDKYINALFERVSKLEQQAESVLNSPNATPPERKLFTNIKSLAGFVDALKLNINL